MRCDKPKEGVCPNRKALKEVCPSMMTGKNQEIDRVMRKSMKDLMNSRTGVCPSVR